MNERRPSCAIILAGAVLACFITICGPAARCQGQTTPAASQPATAPGPHGSKSDAPTTAPAGPAITVAKPKRNWYVAPAPRKPGQTLDQITAAKAAIGSLDPRTGHVMQVEVVREDAAVRTLKLADYFTTVKDKRSFKNDPDAYTKRIARTGADDGHYTLLNHVQKGNKRFLPLATTIYAKLDGEEKFHKLKTKRRWRMTGKTTSGENAQTQSISFYCTVYLGVNAVQAAKNPVLKLTKTYTVNKQDYTVKMSLKADNLSSEDKIVLRVDQSGPTGVPLESHRGDERYVAWGQLAEDNNIDVMIEKKTSLEKENLATRHDIGTTAGTTGEDPKPAILWLGQGNRFFASLMYLNPEAKRKEAANYNAAVWYSAAYESEDSMTHTMGMDIPAWSLAPKAGKTMTFDLFAGPKRRSMFTDEDDKFFKQQYKDLYYVGSINLGGCSWCTFSWITFGMMWLLNVFATVAFGNYGLAIFMLVILVRVVLHPLSKKGQISMAKTKKAMEKIKPRLDKLKEKYAGNRETLQKETMKLYKEQGANPMSSMIGCLPMMLQMPIWIALWTGLNASVELRHTGLLPFWITDLAAPDALFSLGTELPLVGISTFNLLPLLLTVVMFLQMKMNPAASGPSTPEQETQMKMMKYMMPGMMLMFFYNAPSGLSLYIMTSITGGIVETMFIRKHIAEREAAEAAATTTVRIGGKGFRDSREKKPKGPYRKG